MIEGAILSERKRVYHALWDTIDVFVREGRAQGHPLSATYALVLLGLGEVTGAILASPCLETDQARAVFVECMEGTIAARHRAWEE